MSNLKPANLEVVVMFLVSLLLGDLFAERYASESFQILSTSPEMLLVLILLLLSHRLDSWRKWFTLPPLYFHIRNVSIYRKIL